MLEHCDAVGVALNQIVDARERLDWPAIEAEGQLSERWREELWLSADTALRALRRATWMVAVTGPDAMADLAGEMHKADAARVVLAFRSADEWSTVRTELIAARAQFDDLRRQFIVGAQAILASPES